MVICGDLWLFVVTVVICEKRSEERCVSCCIVIILEVALDTSVRDECSSTHTSTSKDFTTFPQKCSSF